MTRRKLNWRSRGECESAGAAYGWNRYGSMTPPSYDRDAAEEGPGPHEARIMFHGRYGGSIPCWRIYVDGRATTDLEKLPEEEAHEDGGYAAWRARARREAERLFWEARDAWEAGAPARAADRAVAKRQREYDETRRVAEARLAKAAPRLLDACKAALGVLTRAGLAYRLAGGPIDEVPIGEMLDRAIAAAEEGRP